MRPENSRSLYQRQSTVKQIHRVSDPKSISSKESLQGYRFEYAIFGAV